MYLLRSVFLGWEEVDSPDGGSARFTVHTRFVGGQAVTVS